MSTSHQPTTKAFTSLSSKDQSGKARRRKAIESNWGCDIQQCLPAQIRPRQREHPKGMPKPDATAPEAPWWMWSYEFIRRLEHISSHTVDNVALAQELIVSEVQQRQQDYTNPARHVAEVMRGDLDRVLATLKARLPDGEVAHADTGQEIQSGSHDTHTVGEVKEEPFDTGVDDDGVTTDMHLTNTEQSSSQRNATHELRAKALRLRARAARLTAEAYEIEADLLADA